MSFLDELKKQTNLAYTENGAISNESTLDPVLDFFSRAGAMRSQPLEALALFKKAYAENPVFAIKTLFYLRDVRGGQGEKDVPRQIINYLSKDEVDTFNKIIEHVPFYGRWDDLPITKETAEFMKSQLEQDLANVNNDKPISVLAKWLPSENTSSKERVRRARDLMRYWGSHGYRKKISVLRKKINLVETQMTFKKWDEINYAHLPSLAGRKYVKAFKRHDSERYEKYIEDVLAGRETMNVKTVYSYEIYNAVQNAKSDIEIKAADAAWKSLPDYTNGVPAIVCADVSGSMTWTNNPKPISISVSLALYFAERNVGPFKDYFLTFSSDSKLVKVLGSTLSSRMNNIQGRDWGGSTNLQSAFDAILKAAIKSKAKQDEIPRVLYIISDMEFNEATIDNDQSNFDVAKKKFQDAGYELPHVVFWNVNARGYQSPATMYDSNVTLISGSSQSTFKYAVEGKTPLESMLDIINSERYERIKL